MSEVWTIGRILTWTTGYFRDKQIESPRLDAEVLLAHVLHSDRVRLYVDFHKPLESHELAAYRNLIKKRSERVPVAYLTGNKEFMGLMFTVSPDVLIPRPETELLVEAALDFLKPFPAGVAMADIGTGSGAIMISVIKGNTNVQGTAIDISPKALAVAKQNAEKLDVAERIVFRQGNMLEGITGKFTLITANLPYIPSGDIENLSPEVHKEPVLALDGGMDGLDLYRSLLEQAPNVLADDGQILLELGIGQAEPIKKFAESSPLTLQKIISDYSGIPRVAILKYRE